MRIVQTAATRFKTLETLRPSDLNKSKSDFWSAAAAVFAQQNRIPRLTRSAQEGQVPLSLAQERLWTLEQSEQGAPYYHVPLTWQILGQLNLPALEKSLNFLVQRHEIRRCNAISVKWPMDESLVSITWQEGSMKGRGRDIFVNQGDV